MDTDAIIEQLPYYPAWIHTARLSHIQARERLLAAERQFKVAAAAAYCRFAVMEKTHYRTENRVALDAVVQQAREARDAAEIAASRAWAEYEQISAMFKVALALLENGQEQSPVP